MDSAFIQVSRSSLSFHANFDSNTEYCTIIHNRNHVSSLETRFSISFFEIKHDEAMHLLFLFSKHYPITDGSQIFRKLLVLVRLF